MPLKKIIATGALYTPYPIAINDWTWTGSRFGFSQICDDTCRIGKGKFYCKHGLAHSQHKIATHSITVCGYIDAGSRVTKDDRLRLVNRGLSDIKVVDWVNKLKRLVEASEVGRAEADALGPLHEINRWAAQVNVIATRMLVKHKDKDFSANFDSASRDMKMLFKASSMLIDAFDYLNIFYNPSSAAFGRRRPVDLYKLVDKIRIILMGAEGASQNKKIYIDGSLRSNLDLYESFKIIPFCLLQNAIKYSFDSDITITFSATAREVEMAVESSGPIISDDEKSKIFDRGYRGVWSQKMHHEGLGFGLYIAKIVADAHDIEIRVRSIPKNYQREGISVCSNTFSIKLPLGTATERRAVLR